MRTTSACLLSQHYPGGTYQYICRAAVDTLRGTNWPARSRRILAATKARAGASGAFRSKERVLSGSLSLVHGFVPNWGGSPPRNGRQEQRRLPRRQQAKMAVLPRKDGFSRSAGGRKSGWMGSEIYTSIHVNHRFSCHQLSRAVK